jgi:hypothetical protein
VVDCFFNVNGVLLSVLQQNIPSLSFTLFLAIMFRQSLRIKCIPFKNERYGAVKEAFRPFLFNKNHTPALFYVQLHNKTMVRINNNMNF